MPRYRLFGDTVDVAAMMNTTGEGGEIGKLFEYSVFLQLLKYTSAWRPSFC